MKIVSVEAIAVHAPSPDGDTYWGAKAWSADGGTSILPYPASARRRYIYSATIDAVLVRVETQDGVIGWGECKAPVGARATAALVNELLAPLVVSSHLDEITVTWERMYAAMRVRGHDSGFWLEALSGIDIALWDAWGRHVGQPVSSLLGGAFRTEVPLYASGIPATPGPGGQDAVRQQAEQLQDCGFSAIKVAIGVDPATDLASVATVRDVLGPHGTVLADAAGQYDVSHALRVGRGLEELDVGFFEMPTPPEDIHAYRTLAAKLDIPLALDSITTRHRALEFLRAEALRVLQPDVCRAGGITELMRIATLADAFGAVATPHISIGSAVHFAASLHCAAAIPNLDIMEHWIGQNPLGHDLAPDLDRPTAGRRLLPSQPGLGISIDETAVRTVSWA